MKKSKILILPFKTSKLFIIIGLIIVSLLFYLSSLIIINFTDDKYNKIHIDNNELFVVSTDNEQIVDDFTEIFPLQSENDLKNEIPFYQVTKGTNLYDVEINIPISYPLSEKITKYTTDSDSVIQYIFPIYSDELVTSKNMPNPYYQIEYIINGTYPQHNNEILIGEYVALSYIDELGLKTYDDLLNKEIEIEVNNKVYKFKITGIGAGSTWYYVNSNHELFKNMKPNVNYSSYYKKFDTEDDKNNFILKNKEQIYYLDSDYNVINLSNYVITITIIMSLVVYLIIIIYPLKKIIYVLGYYQENKQKLLVIVLPLLCYIILVSVLYIIFKNTY